MVNKYPIPSLKSLLAHNILEQFYFSNQTLTDVLPKTDLDYFPFKYFKFYYFSHLPCPYLSLSYYQLLFRLLKSPSMIPLHTLLFSPSLYPNFKLSAFCLLQNVKMIMLSIKTLPWLPVALKQNNRSLIGPKNTRPTLTFPASCNTTLSCSELHSY